MRGWIVLALLLLGTCSAVAADEPSGCDKFQWGIERERAALTSPDRTRLTSGGELGAVPSVAVILALHLPAAAAGLPSPPERPPKEGTFAGFASFKNAPKAGLYTISLSAGGWIDVLQEGHFLKPVAFSSATGCDGIRKTVKYQLAASPFVLQVSGVNQDSISIAILPSQ